MSLFRAYNEFRRALQVTRVVFDLILDVFLARMYQPRGLTSRPLLLRMFAGFLRIILRKPKSQPGIPVQLRRTLERLGPTYVKLGQALSLRDDILPERFTRELSKLQNQVPPVLFNDILKVIEIEFAMPAKMVFREIEEVPLAAASLAQAHMARLRNGRKVLIKVQRPGVFNLIISDINIMRRIAGWMEKIPGLRDYRPVRFVEEFADYTMRELDFTQEARHADQFRENFKSDPYIIFPEIFWDYTTKRVLTMQYIDGVNPDDSARLKSLGIDGKRMAETGARAILKMMFVDGFFHADPHPGNVIVVGRSKIAWIDLGITGTFSREIKRDMFLYYYYIIQGEYDTATGHLLDLTEPGGQADPDGFRLELADAIKHWNNPEGKSYTIGKFILETLNIGARHQLYFPRELVLSSKAFLTLESLARILDPESDMVEISKPYMEEIFRSNLSITRIGKSVVNSLPDYLEFLEQLPKNVLKTLNMISSGKIQVQLADESRQTDKSSKNIWNPLIAASSLLAGAYFAVSDTTPGPIINNIPVLAGLPVLSIIMFGISAIIMYFSSRTAKRN